MKIKLIGILLITVFISACSSKDKADNELAGYTPEYLYDEGVKSLNAGDYNKAVKYLEAVDLRGGSKNRAQVKLDLIYLYYKLDLPENAIPQIDSYLRSNSKNIDYVLYLRGLTNMQSGEYFFHNLLKIDRSTRDPGFSKAAFNDFNNLITNFPNSKYVSDAKQRMIYIKNKLANHSLQIAEYYLSMDAWTAAAKRAQLVMEEFPGSNAIERSLEIMIKSYDKLEQNTLKQHTLDVLATNYPDNKLVRR